MLLAIFAAGDFSTPLVTTAWLLLWSLGTLGLALTFWSMLPDTVEYGEWKTGQRTESFIFGLFQFFLKVALGVGAGLFGWLLDRAGYVANQPQTPETIAGIKDIMIWLPGAGFIVAGIAMIFYPIRKGTHETIVEEIAARRSGAVAAE